MVAESEIKSMTSAEKDVTMQKHPEEEKKEEEPLPVVEYAGVAESDDGAVEPVPESNDAAQEQKQPAIEQKESADGSEKKKKRLGLKAYLASLASRNKAKKEYLAKLKETNKAKKKLLNKKGGKEVDTSAHETTTTAVTDGAVATPAAADDTPKVEEGHVDDDANVVANEATDALADENAVSPSAMSEVTTDMEDDDAAAAAVADEERQNVSSPKRGQEGEPADAADAVEEPTSPAPVLSPESPKPLAKEGTIEIRDAMDASLQQKVVVTEAEQEHVVEQNAQNTAIWSCCAW